MIILIVLTSGVASVPVLADDELELDGSAVDVAALELLDGALSVLLAVVADDALVFADVTVSGAVTDFAGLAHEVFEILPAKKGVLFPGKYKKITRHFFTSAQLGFRHFVF